MNQTNVFSQTKINPSWSQALNRFEHHFTFTFSDRAQYREFTRLWKANYAGLGFSLRGQKRLVAATQRRNEYAGKNQQRLVELKHEATMQLEMRQAAKAEAQRQYMVAKEKTSS